MASRSVKYSAIQIYIYHSLTHFTTNAYVNSSHAAVILKNPLSMITNFACCQNAYLLQMQTTLTVHNKLLTSCVLSFMIIDYNRFHRSALNALT